MSERGIITLDIVEPVLTYKKGEGWVYAPEPVDFYCEAVASDGKRCRVYKREPKRGDYWFGARTDDTPEIIQTFVQARSSQALKREPWVGVAATVATRVEYIVVFDE